MDEDDILTAEMSDEEIMAAIQKDGSFIRNVEQTPERCFAAVRQNGRSLRFIARDKVTKELCMAAVERDGRGVRGFPHEFLTHDLCLKGVKDDPDLFEYLPKEFKTPEVTLEAVKSSSRLLRFIPKGEQTTEMCMAAVKDNCCMLTHVSRKLLSHDVYLAAVIGDGAALKRVPDEFRTEEMYLQALISLGIRYNKELEKLDISDNIRTEDDIIWLKLELPDEINKVDFYSNAVKQDGRALHCLPDGMRTSELCSIAVEQSGLVLYSVPIKERTKEICSKAVRQNGRALNHVPHEAIDEQMCVIAVTDCPMALRYVPDELKTKELCNAAVRSDWRSFAYVLDEMYTANACVEIYERMISGQNEHSYRWSGDERFFREVLGRLSDNQNNDARIFRLRKQFDTRSFEIKSYNNRTKKFITEQNCVENIKRKFDTFDDFYDFLYGNLTGADLLDYDFKGIDLSKYDIEGAHISIRVLAEHGLYDDSFYEKNIGNSENNTNLLFSAKNEIVEAASVLHETDIIPITTMTDNSLKVYYISDIHLNHKLQKKFPEHATEQQVKDHIRSLVEMMFSNMEFDSYRNVLLIAGDTSFNFEISSIFYKELKKVWHGKIAVVLGNHELWGHGLDDLPSDRAERLECIILKYRNMLESLNIELLQNDLLLSSGKIIPEKQLSSMDSKEITALCLRSSYLILGGLGYSGLCSEFNATHGAYRETIKSLNEDVRQTERFEILYKKMKDAVYDRQVIVLTHTPKENWSKEDYNQNWIYVNGHTHLNEYYCTDEKTVYADNQVGYYSDSMGLKHFYVSGQYDPFRYYPDGIYLISREEYQDFNRGKKIHMTFNRTCGCIHMLKNRGMYCFIFEDGKTGTISLLNGGRISKLDNNDINYYFEKMPDYSKRVKESFGGYHQALMSISDNIKKIGGDGTIHGCIIDIDFLNHIYVNPIDGKITPYFAKSIVDKWIYKDVKTLLKKQRTDLYENYAKLLKSGAERILLLEGKASAEKVNAPIYVPETQIYGPSRVMRSIQYLTDDNVIRIWDDRIVNARTSIENKIDLHQRQSIDEGTK